MALGFDGQQDFGGGVIGYNFSDPETGESFVLDDPMEAQQLQASIGAGSFLRPPPAPAQSAAPSPVAPMQPQAALPAPQQAFAPNLDRQMVQVAPQSARPEIWQPTSFKMQGVPSQEAISEQQRLMREERELLEQKRERDRKVFEADKFAAQESIERSQDQMIDFRLRRQEVDQEASRRQAAIGEIQRGIESQKVDPGRFFKSKTTAENIGLAIAYAFSNMGAALQTIGSGQRHDSQVGQMVMQAIEQDIQLQKEAIAGRRQDLATSKEGLAEFYRLYGDPASAEDQIRIMGERVAQQELELNRMGDGSQIDQAVDAEILASKQREAQYIANITERAAGVVSGKVIPARGASGGGERPETEKEYRDRVAFELATGKSLATIDKDRALAAKGRREASGDVELNRDVQDMSKRFEDTGLTEAGAGLAQVYQAINNATGGDPEGDIPGVGGLSGYFDFIGQSGIGDKDFNRGIADFIAGEKGKDVRVAMVNAADLILRSRTGAVVHPEERAEIERLKDGNFNTDAEFRRGLEVLSKVFRAKEQNITKGYGARVVEEYRSRNPPSPGLAPMPANSIQFEPIR